MTSQKGRNRIAQFKYMTFIYSQPFIHHFTGLFGNHTVVGLLAQLVEHCTGIAKVMSSNPVQA